MPGAPAISRRRLVAGLALLAGASLAAGCSAAPSGTRAPDGRRPAWSDPDVGVAGLGAEPVGLSFATRFTLDRLDGGLALACLADGTRYLLVGEGAPVPAGLARDVVVLQAPLDGIYLASSASYCLFDALDAVGAVGLMGTSPQACTVEAFARAYEEGRVGFGGRYSSPDYELILSAGTRLAVENTMINHAPEIRDKLEALGVPVLMEQSSTEPEPLGRLEWIRLWGALLGKDALADQVFDAQAAAVEEVARELARTPLDKTVAFFYINANGSAVVRKPGDYVARMIAMAGGTYAFEALEADGSASSTTTMEMEAFYAGAKDADVVVYNSTVAGELRGLSDLLALNPLLADFKAVREGEAWCTEQNVYQQMTETGDVVRDLHAAFAGGAPDRLDHLFRLV